MANNSAQLGRLAFSAAAALSVCGAALGQSTPAATPPAPVSSQPVARSTGIPQRDTLIKMQRMVTITFTDTRMEDAMKFIAEVTGADIDPMWADDQNTSGLDKDKTINLKIEKRTALDTLEKILEKATTDSTGAGGNTWQLSESGTLQAGPRERLNKFKRVELYSVKDLLLDIPNYADAPQFDLQSVLQSAGQGGGGNQSPFRETGTQNQGLQTKPLQERIDDLIKILTELVEPEQWQENGGDGASMRYYQGSLIVNGPDYVHRQLAGYPYWSQHATRVAFVNKRRYVTLGVDTALAGLSGIENQPVTIPPK
ncbi:MAG: hypothetical protein JSR77_11315 [Planctomycetes bacterium]|nr:hypothetical protein [Planctomycetota bacterium]